MKSFLEALFSLPMPWRCSVVCFLILSCFSLLIGAVHGIPQKDKPTAFGWLFLLRFVLPIALIVLWAIRSLILMLFYMESACVWRARSLGVSIPNSLLAFGHFIGSLMISTATAAKWCRYTLKNLGWKHVGIRRSITLSIVVNMISLSLWNGWPSDVYANVDSSYRKKTFHKYYDFEHHLAPTVPHTRPDPNDLPKQSIPSNIEETQHNDGTSTDSIISYDGGSCPIAFRYPSAIKVDGITYQGQIVENSARETGLLIAFDNSDDGVASLQIKRSQTPPDYRAMKLAKMQPDSEHLHYEDISTQTGTLIAGNECQHWAYLEDSEQHAGRRLHIDRYLWLHNRDYWEVKVRRSVANEPQCRSMVDLIIGSLKHMD